MITTHLEAEIRRLGDKLDRTEERLRLIEHMLTMFAPNPNDTTVGDCIGYISEALMNHGDRLASIEEAKMP